VKVARRRRLGAAGAETRSVARACYFTLFSRSHPPSQPARPAIASADKVRVNQEIRAKKVRVVEPDGEHEVLALDDALARAREFELDLVEIAPDARPPVCKIIDYGKYRYEQQKKEKMQRKRSKAMQMKEIRFRPRTDTHDFNFKTNHARGFLEDGNKVKAYVQFRGRDIIYKDQGMDILRRFIEELQDLAKIDQPPKMEGRRMVTVLAPSD
jgi:translation initiation factor IF-3